MTTHNDDAAREVQRQQRAARRHATSTPRAGTPYARIAQTALDGTNP